MLQYKYKFKEKIKIKTSLLSTAGLIVGLPLDYYLLLLKQLLYRLVLLCIVLLLPVV
jgi:hypothetical protein